MSFMDMICVLGLYKHCINVFMNLLSYPIVFLCYSQVSVHLKRINSLLMRCEFLIINILLHYSSIRFFYNTCIYLSSFRVASSRYLVKD